MSKATYLAVMGELEKMSNAETLSQMNKFGINPKKAYGVGIAHLRKLHKLIGMDDPLARQLWGSPIHEAKILGSMVADPGMLNETDVEKLLRNFDSWDLVDEFCLNLFSKSRLGFIICLKYNNDKEEFVKRAAFSTMAIFAAHHNNMSDKKFERFLSIIMREASDERNFVKKAVNWALRQIGKRNINLNGKAIGAALKIQRFNNPTAQWIAKNALEELQSESVQKRLRAAQSAPKSQSRSK